MLIICTVSDLDDPRPVIASLFGSSTTSSLPPRILALYVHNGVKIYASWLSALAEAWDESSIDQIRSITTALENQLAECAKSQDVELQERAAELHGLLQLVRTGLDAPRPVVHSTATAGEGPSDEAGGFASSSRAPPRSLNLLDPLFFSHELNPVNPKAQGLVTVPEGLDLDVAINASAWAAEDGASADEREPEVDEFGRLLRVAVVASEETERAGKKKKKGKGVSGKKSKRRDVEDAPEELSRVRSVSSAILLRSANPSPAAPCRAVRAGTGRPLPHGPVVLVQVRLRRRCRHYPHRQPRHRLALASRSNTNSSAARTDAAANGGRHRGRVAAWTRCTSCASGNVDTVCVARRATAGGEGGAGCGG